MDIEQGSSFHFRPSTKFIRQAPITSVVDHFITNLNVPAEAHLRLLLTRQRKHVDEIKKATNYDSTRKLLERYDESVPTSPPQGGMGMGMGMGMPPSQTQQTRGTGSAPTTPVKNVKKEQESSPSGSERTGSPRAPGHLVGAGGTPVRGKSNPH